MSSFTGPLILGNLFLRTSIISLVSSTDKVVWVAYETGSPTFMLLASSTV